MGYRSQNWKDSASFVKYHIGFMDSLDLDPYNKRKIYTTDESFLRRTFFNVYVNKVSGLKLFKISESQKTPESDFAEVWAGLGQIDFSQ